MTTRYLIKCDDCKAIMGETAELQRSAAGGRCAPCRGYTRGSRAWMETRQLARWPDGKRKGMIAFAWKGNECVRFVSDKSLTGQPETVHWKYVHLEPPTTGGTR